MARYPLDMPHPNGSRTLTVFDPSEHRAALAEFQRFREHHQASLDAARTGRDAPPALPLPDDDDLLVPPGPLDTAAAPGPEPVPLPLRPTRPARN